MVLLNTMTSRDAGGPIPPATLRERLNRSAGAAGIGQVEAVTPLAVDGASLTYSATLTSPAGVAQELVVKVAPPGLAPVRNRDVLRQARIYRVAEAVPGVPVPSVVLEDAGAPPDEPPWFAMTREPGDCVEPIFDGPPLPAPAGIRARALSAVGVLASLHQADPRKLGIDDPPVDLRAEVERWVRAFATVEEGLASRSAAATDLLRSRIPAPVRPALVHGDFRLGNLLCVGGEVSAVIDWELWAVSDPRIDLAWFLLHRDPSDNPHGSRSAPGMPTGEELIEAYARQTDARFDDLGWFHALARFKQAAAGALILKRAPTAADRDRRAARLRRQVDDAVELLTR